MTTVTRRGVIKGGLVGSAFALGTTGIMGPVAFAGAPRWRPYVDRSSSLKFLPFGTSSHYLQPWRSYAEVVPASRFLSGVGVVLDEGQQTPDAVIDLLAANGVKTVRLEIPWGAFRYDDETRLSDPAPFARVLRACRRREIRVLVLLNAHHGLPGPALQVERHAAGDAQQGATSIVLDSVAGLVPGRSGISNQTEFWAAENLITAIDGSRVTLAKPLAARLPAGSPLDIAVLKYAPFGAVDTADTQETLGGWVRYVAAAATFVTSALDTAGAQDKKFDLEIWNELSFGSKYLSLANYMDPDPGPTNTDAVQTAIVALTADLLERSSIAFSGVKATNGFASTIPWPAASMQPAAICALSKHPYPRALTFPASEVKGTRRVDARGQPTDFIPSYTAYFPEYFATAIQTESAVRDMGPEVCDIQGAAHGRLARVKHGEVLPVPVWVTEIGANPGEIGVRDAKAAAKLKAKAVARFLLFYLNKGAERVYLYSATGGDLGYGLIPDAGRRYIEQTALNPGQLIDAPALTVIRQLAAALGDGSAPLPDGVRKLGFRVEETYSSYRQFLGDGTSANPPLQNADELVILPFQVNQGRFVIAYYFMTRDIRKPAPPEFVRIEVSGIDVRNAIARIYDAASDRWITHAMSVTSDDTLDLSLQVDDVPRLVSIDEQRETVVRSSSGSRP